MDGGGSDIIGDPDSRKWYTTIAAAVPDQSLDLRQKDVDDPFFGGPLPLQISSERV